MKSLALIVKPYLVFSTVSLGDYLKFMIRGLH